MVSLPQRLIRTSAAAPRPVRVAVCFESALWNELLAAALAAVPALAVVGAAPPPAISPAMAVDWRAEVGVTHLLPCARHWRWFDRLRVLLAPTAWIVFGSDDQPHAARLLRAGARGYLYADTGLKTLIKAIVTVRDGQLWADHRLAAAALDLSPSGAAAGAPGLTTRERGVLEAVGRGKRNKEIAAELGITETTVKAHLNRIYKKLRVSDRLQAGLLAARDGWS
ncbi:MAG: response regulator transcription factor [Terriglobales bacterium]